MSKSMDAEPVGLAGAGISHLPALPVLAAFIALMVAAAGSDRLEKQAGDGQHHQGVDDLDGGLGRPVRHQRADDCGGQDHLAGSLDQLKVDQPAAVVLVDADARATVSTKMDAATACCAVISGTGRNAYPMISHGSISADPVTPLKVAVDANRKQAMPWNQ
jgi:hypothetical protein